VKPPGINIDTHGDVHLLITVDRSATAATKVEDLRKLITQLQLGPMFARVLTSGAIEVTDLDSCPAEVVWEEMTSGTCIRAYDPDDSSSSDRSPLLAFQMMKLMRSQR